MYMVYHRKNTDDIDKYIIDILNDTNLEIVSLVKRISNLKNPGNNNKVLKIIIMKNIFI